MELVGCPIRYFLRVFREYLRVIRIRPFFHDHLRVPIATGLGLASGSQRRRDGRDDARFHDYLRVPDRAFMLSVTT